MSIDCTKRIIYKRFGKAVGSIEVTSESLLLSEWSVHAPAFLGCLVRNFTSKLSSAFLLITHSLQSENPTATIHGIAMAPRKRKAGGGEDGRASKVTTYTCTQ